jgi:predicted extracellular nuclease
LAAAQQYSYTFDGNAQTLDHIIVNQPALAVVNRFAYARDDADFPVKNYELATNCVCRITISRSFICRYFYLPAPDS